MSQRPRIGRGLGLVLAVSLVVATSLGAGVPRSRVNNLFAQFDLPDAWEARFWGDPAVKGLLALEPKALAELVPVQAGIRYCRCPACDASEVEDPLGWAVDKPAVLTCRRCGVAVPNDKFPAKDEKDKKVPEEVVDVLPRVTHHYPYHVVEAAKQRYPDERLYLAAKRDYEARQFLSKAALYAAVRYHESPEGSKDPALARLASVLILRFAQTYPAYATHFDQPESPKVFQQADLPPPYRRGYRTGKWDWTAGLDVPLQLVIAYALVRDDPTLQEAGRALGDLHPSKTIERDLFRASAEFVRMQPEEFSEKSLQAYRGILAVGRLLDDASLVHEALARLDGFAERGFYHDGLWREGDAASHRRILELIDGWLDRLLVGYSDPPGYVLRPNERRIEHVAGVAGIPVLGLARSAGATVLSDPPTPEIQQAAWPAVETPAVARHPALLGGAGLARLAVGEGPGAIDLELKGQDSIGSPHFQRQAFRLDIGGRPVLGDLDDLPPIRNGWDRATASHNTVLIDGLNQRESLRRAKEPTLGGNFLYFAADRDFQVATLDDPSAYPQSATRYRQTMIAASGPRSSYAIGVFEVEGGLQHDQVFHGAPGSLARWELSVATSSAPSSLLPVSIPYVSTARAEDGRWFVQAYGEFAPLAQARVFRPVMASLTRPDAPGVRVHVLGDMPASVLVATSPDPASPATREPGEDPGRAGMIVRRRSLSGATLKSTFVTVFEPTAGPSSTLSRVGRVVSPEGSVVVHLETADGPEQVVVNLTPGAEIKVPLVEGRSLVTDGLVVRVSTHSLVLAGGTFAETAGRRVEQSAASGKIKAAVRKASAKGRGWFETNTPLGDAPTLAGRILLIRHGDGTTRGWTLQRVETHENGSRLYVREEPGFTIDDKNDSVARYYQFPRNTAPWPHEFRISKMSRVGDPVATPVR